MHRWCKAHCLLQVDMTSLHKSTTNHLRHTVDFVAGFSHRSVTFRRYLAVSHAARRFTICGYVPLSRGGRRRPRACLGSPPRRRVVWAVCGCSGSGGACLLLPREPRRRQRWGRHSLHTGGGGSSPSPLPSCRAPPARPAEAWEQQLSPAPGGGRRPAAA